MFRCLAPASLTLPAFRRQQAAVRQFAEIRKAKARLSEQLEALDQPARRAAAGSVWGWTLLLKSPHALGSPNDTQLHLGREE
jgi:hypothetical protein